MAFVGLFYLFGFLFGVTKTIIFDASQDGKYASVKKCEKEGPDGNNCLIYGDEQLLNLKDASITHGDELGKIFGSISILFGIVVALILDKNGIEIKIIKNKQKK